MSILANIGTNNWLSIVVKPEIPSQAESGMQVPCLFGIAECTIQIYLFPVPIVDCPPNPRLLEILEDSSEKHVVSLLLQVKAARPIADVQAILSESARQKLNPLLAAQIPRTGRQMRARSGDFSSLRSGDFSFLKNAGIAARSRRFRLLRLAHMRPSLIRIHLHRRSRILGSGSTRLSQGGFGEDLIGSELAFEPEIRILQEHAGVEEAGAAESQLVESRPTARRCCRRRGREKIGDDGGNRLGALRFAAEVTDKRREFGGDAGEACPVARIILELVENVENDIVGEHRESIFRHGGNANLLHSTIG
nr:hypothetical protein MIMGU_mgv1a016592mg [Ipomoea batatas]GME08964.1 hypothetical protein MIMGU_mgv1a016592mg [Ipomoea batatas]